jgi:hypothetical protein
MSRSRSQVDPHVDGQFDPRADARVDPQAAFELRKGRSRVTNGTRLFLAAAGIDYRSTKARRFKDLVDAYQREFEVTTESDMNLVRDAAGLTLKCEEMQAAQIRGETIASDQIVRMSGARRRVLSELKRRSPNEWAPAPTIASHWGANHEQHDDNEGSDE